MPTAMGTSPYLPAAPSGLMWGQDPAAAAAALWAAGFQAAQQMNAAVAAATSGAMPPATAHLAPATAPALGQAPESAPAHAPYTATAPGGRSASHAPRNFEPPALPPALAEAGAHTSDMRYHQVAHLCYSANPTRVVVAPLHEDAAAAGRAPSSLEDWNLAGARLAAMPKKRQGEGKNPWSAHD